MKRMRYSRESDERLPWLFPIDRFPGPLLLVLCLLLLSAGNARAADLFVPETYPTLQAGVDAANPSGGDTIHVAAGAYPENVVISKGVTVEGAGDGTDPLVDTIVDGSNSGRVFTITGEVTVTLRKLRIQGGQTNVTGTGSVADGGGIANSGTLIVDRCTLSGNTAVASGSMSVAYGGGIANSGALTIDRCTLTSNTAVASGYSSVVWGGGIANGGTLAITNSTLSGNSASVSGQGSIAYGGGINNYYNNLEVTNSLLSGNTASASGDNSAVLGGGIANGGTLTVTNSTLSGNTATDTGSFGDAEGGGINNWNQVTVASSLLSGNTASASGDNSVASGGSISSSGTLIVTNSTLSGNAVFSSNGSDLLASGGGLNNRGTLTVTNSTLSDNTASVSGDNSVASGGGVNNQGALMLQNSLLAHSGAAGNYARSSDLASLTSNGHNLSDDASIPSGAGDLVNTDPILGPLQDNGGPTFTHALLPGSPAVNAGLNSDAPPTDQRGFVRIRAGDPTSDIGAFEVIPPLTLTLLGDNPMTVECHTVFTDPGATAQDASGNDLTNQIQVTGNVNPDALGTYTLTYQVSDGIGTVTATRTVQVVDTKPPVITNKSGKSLAPPDHRYITLKVADCIRSAIDACDGDVLNQVRIVRVYSDEPEDAPGNDDGATLNDIVIASDGKSVRVRAECNEKGNGRIYQILFRAEDSSGNAAYKPFWVEVRSDPAKSAVNDGAEKGYTVYGS